METCRPRINPCSDARDWSQTPPADAAPRLNELVSIAKCICFRSGGRALMSDVQVAVSDH